MMQLVIAWNVHSRMPLQLHAAERADTPIVRQRLVHLTMPVLYMRVHDDAAQVLVRIGN